MQFRSACIMSAVLGINALCFSVVEAAREWAPQEVAAILAQSYAQLLMRPMGVESSSLQKNVSARKDLVSSCFERVIHDVSDGKEYRDRFGDTKVPQVSSEKQAAVGCPHVAL